MAHTVVNDLFDDAPKKRVLKGDKRKPEPGTHIIEFPGGAIELARLDNGDYWAHITINRGQALAGMRGTNRALGEVVSSRIDWDGRTLEGIPSLPDGANLTQLAVLIRPDFAETQGQQP